MFQMSANNGAFPRRCGQSHGGRRCDDVVPSEQAYRRHLVRYHRLQLVVRHVAGERLERLVAIPAEEARRRIRMLNCRQGGRADERRRRRDGDDRTYRGVRPCGHRLQPPSSSAAGDGQPEPSRRGGGHGSPTYRGGRSGPPSSRDSSSPVSSAAGDGHPGPYRRGRSRDLSPSDGGHSIPPRRPPRSSGSQRAGRNAESHRRWSASGAESTSSSPERDDAPPTVRVRAIRTREGCRPADYRPTSASSTTSEVEPDVPSDHLESDADGGRWTDVSLLDLDIDVADLEMPPATAMRDVEVMADIPLPPPPPIYYRLTADTQDAAVQC